MKKYLALGISLLCLLGLMGCALVPTQPTTPPEPTPTPKTVDLNQLWEGIAAATPDTKWQDMSSETISQVYRNLDQGNVAEGFIRMTTTADKPDEIVVLKMKNANTAQSAMDGPMKERLNYKNTEWEAYIPAQHAIVQQAVLVTRGQYVVFIVHPDAQKILGVIDQALA